MKTYKVTFYYTLAKVAFVNAEDEQQAVDIADTLLIENPEFEMTDESIEGVLSYSVYKDFEYTDTEEVE
jgi:hypothetical protein